MSLALIFEIVIILLGIGLYVYMKKNGYRNINRKFIILIIAILLFELMTEPMFINKNLDFWTYLYKDISWIITLGWVIIIMGSMLIVDYIFRDLAEKKRFWIYLLFITGIVVPVETFLLQSGLREYAPELLARTSGIFIPLTSIPLESVFVVPIFISLIISFYKYLNYIWVKK